MKVTMLTVMCGPEGNAFPGTVLDIPDNKKQTVWDATQEKNVQVPMTDYLFTNKMARPFDSQKDAKAKQYGLVRAER